MSHPRAPCVLSQKSYRNCWQECLMWSITLAKKTKQNKMPPKQKPRTTITRNKSLLGWSCIYFGVIKYDWWDLLWILVVPATLEEKPEIFLDLRNICQCLPSNYMKTSRYWQLKDFKRDLLLQDLGKKWQRIRTFPEDKLPAGRNSQH